MPYKLNMGPMGWIPQWFMGKTAGIILHKVIAPSTNWDFQRTKLSSRAIQLVTKKHLPCTIRNTYAMNENLTARPPKKLIKVHSPLSNTSFGSFCVQIGELFEPHWVFEDSVKSNLLKQKRRQIRTFSDLHMLSLAIIMKQFEYKWHKRHEKNRN